MNTSFGWGRRLRPRLMLPLALTGLMLGGLGSWLALVLVRDNFERQLVRRGESLGHTINLAAEILGPGPNLRRFIKSVGAERDVLDIVIVSGEPSTVIAATRRGWIDKPVAELGDTDIVVALQRTLEDLRLWHMVDRDTNRMIFAEPLLLKETYKRDIGLTPGVVMVIIDGARVDRPLWLNAQILIVAWLAVVIVMCALIWFGIERRVLRQVRALDQTMALRGQGDVSTRTEVLESHELGRLAESFNHLLDCLQEQESELRARQIELELAHTDALETNVQLTLAVDRNHQLATEATIASQMKSDFVANMSHEIRTPMNGILGMTQLLMDSNLNRDQKEYAQTVYQSATALMALLNDMLDFSKIERGALDLVEQDFDLRVLVEGVGDLMGLRAQAKGLELVCFIDPETPSLVTGDPGRLRQVLLNLVGNAVKFTEKGEITLTVMRMSEGDGVVTLQFEVSDTGVGIPAHQMEDLFTPFTQGDGSSTRRHGGAGLGLAISRRLVELLGGEIRVTSTVGKGSVFVLELPCKIQTRIPRLNPPNAEALRGTHVLGVDDSATNLRMLRHQIESWGCRFQGVSDAQAAIHALREAAEQGDPFQVAILDMNMPDQDGEHLGRDIKAVGDLRDTSLVMMSSMGRRGDVARLEKIGFAGYLNKPLKQRYLYECLVEIVGGSPDSHLTKIVTRHSLDEVKRRRTRILVAEDNVVNRKVTLRVLHNLGYPAEAVTNGREAVNRLAEERFDLVLMDCQMPEMDGYQATQWVRHPDSDVLDHDVTIIAMTAHAMKGDREKCLAVGMNDYLTKPVDPKALVDVIEQWLWHREASEEA